MTLDYRREEYPSGLVGKRFVTADEEWRDPTWRCCGYDSVDWGVQLRLGAGRVFSVGWVRPGQLEGLDIRNKELLGSMVDGDYDNVAVWDVTTRSHWSGLISQRVSEVFLRYAQWAPGEPGLWLPRLTLRFSGGNVVEVLLGEGSADQPVQASATNVAVLFDPPELPPWLKS
jgi:hypothetical protein